MAVRFSKLTRPAIRSLKPGASITEHGITFRRDATGDGVYSVNVMVDRKRIHRVIGRESEGVTRQQAEDFIAQARTDARHQRLQLPEPRAGAPSRSGPAAPTPAHQDDARLAIDLGPDRGAPP